jgi:hypothetical protein
MTRKSDQRVPEWLTVDVMVICVPIAIIGLAVLVAI